MADKSKGREFNKYWKWQATTQNTELFGRFKVVADVLFNSIKSKCIPRSKECMPYLHYRACNSRILNSNDRN